MTDEQIIKALKCCSTASCISKQCPYEKTHDIPKCTTKLTKDALDLINRLQTDQEALIAGQETLQKALAEKNTEIERLNNHITDVTKMVKAEIKGVE